MELWWNLDILWWNLDRFEHKFDGNITNWPCWSEGKLGTGPFTWLGQGFHTNFLEIPFQKGEKRHFDGLSIARKIGLILTPVFCNASRNSFLALNLGQPNCCNLVVPSLYHTWLWFAVFPFFQRDHDTALSRWPWAMNFWSILQIQSVQFLFRLETGFKRSHNSEEVAEN